MRKSTIELGQVEAVAVACQMALQHAPTYGARFHLREVLRVLQPHAQDFEAEKQRLIEQYAVRDADGKPVVVSDVYQFGDAQPEVDRLWRELTATKVDVSHNLTLTDVADVPANPALDALDWLLL